MRRRSGFTLMEVLVAFFIISVCTGAILLGVLLSLTQSKSSREQIMAQMLASSTIEELRAHVYGSEDPPPGWSTGANGWSRTVSIPAVVGGIASPTEYEMTLVPSSGSDQSAGTGQTAVTDTVTLNISWREESSPQGKMETLSMAIPMAAGWNRQIERGVAPSAVAGNWHEPAKYTIPTEPSYRIGDADHTVSPQVPDSGNIINNDTSKLQGLVQQLNAAQTQLDAAQAAVATDKQNIVSTQSQLSTAQNAQPPDASLVSQLQAQLTQQQGQLGTDQGTVNTLQQQVDSLKQQIAQAGTAG